MSYALIQNARVVDVSETDFPVHPSFFWVEIPSGETVFPGYTYADGVFSAPPAPPPPTLSQQAGSLLASGLAITSTSTPALDGTYRVASGVPFGREDIANEAQFISTFSEFTNGSASIEWPLIDGTTFVTFPSTTEFLAFAKAAAQFFAACRAIQLTNSGTLPSASVTIA